MFFNNFSCSIHARFLKKRFLGIVVLIQSQEAREDNFKANQYAPNTLQSSMSLNSRGMAGLELSG